MSNNKQSSVEWFAIESWKLRIELEGGKISIGEYANKYYKLKEQAKAMHEEEIIKAMSVAFIDGAKIGGITYESPYEDWEQYYNETFGSQTTLEQEEQQ